MVGSLILYFDISRMFGLTIDKIVLPTLGCSSPRSDSPSLEIEKMWNTRIMVSYYI